MVVIKRFKRYLRICKKCAVKITILMETFLTVFAVGDKLFLSTHTVNQEPGLIKVREKWTFTIFVDVFRYLKLPFLEWRLSSKFVNKVQNGHYEPILFVGYKYHFFRSFLLSSCDVELKKF